MDFLLHLSCKLFFSYIAKSSLVYIKHKSSSVQEKKYIKKKSEKSKNNGILLAKARQDVSK